jgi:hypothetical protein
MCMKSSVDTSGHLVTNEPTSLSISFSSPSWSYKSLNCFPHSSEQTKGMLDGRPGVGAMWPQLMHIPSRGSFLAARLCALFIVICFLWLSVCSSYRASSEFLPVWFFHHAFPFRHWSPGIYPGPPSRSCYLGFALQPTPTTTKTLRRVTQPKCSAAVATNASRDVVVEHSIDPTLTVSL